jgi:hypothetical protein
MQHIFFVGKKNELTYQDITGFVVSYLYFLFVNWYEFFILIIIAFWDMFLSYYIFIKSDFLVF